jgi:uncharacterized protein (TIGR00730 family)
LRVYFYVNLNYLNLYIIMNPKEITVFGWKRKYLPYFLYKCELLSKKLAENNICVVTGGGHGFMKSANRGAYNVNPLLSKGIIVSFLDENRNTYIIDKNVIETHNFQDRKKHLIKNKVAFIYFPGGMGTMDEFTELINLYKTKEINIADQKPIYLVGKEYWNNLCNWFLTNTKSWPYDKITLITDNIDDIINDLKIKKII